MVNSTQTGFPSNSGFDVSRVGGFKNALRTVYTFIVDVDVCWQLKTS